MSTLNRNRRDNRQGLLFANHVILDCSNKTLIFPKPECSVFLSTNEIIASSKEGAQEYMLLFSLEVKEGLGLNIIPVVRDFLECLRISQDYLRHEKLNFLLICYQELVLFQ